MYNKGITDKKMQKNAMGKVDEKNKYLFLVIYAQSGSRVSDPTVGGTEIDVESAAGPWLF